MSIRLRNCLPMFDATCLLYGGLNHVMFLFLLFFGLLFWLMVGLYSNLQSYPLFFRASWYGGICFFEYFFIGGYV